MLFNMQGLQSYLRRSWCSQASRCEKHFACHLTLSLITTGKACNAPSTVLRPPRVFTYLILQEHHEMPLLMIHGIRTELREMTPALSPAGERQSQDAIPDPQCAGPDVSDRRGNGEPEA